MSELSAKKEDAPERYTRAYTITRVLVRLMMPLLGGITVIGAENIPETGPIILAPNHRAYMDPPYLSMVTKRQLHLMAKDQLFRIPLFGPYIKAMGAFPVKRGSADRAALKQAMAELKAGRVMGIFPEGTRADPGTLLPAEKGFALVAKQTGVPIVPIALEGTDKVLPKHGRLHRAHVTATIGKPMTAAEMLAAYPDSSKDSLTIISEATMRAIAALMSEPVVILSAAPPVTATSKKTDTPKNNAAKKWVFFLTLSAAGIALALFANRKHR